jgi:hypothetical protein
MSTSQIPAEPGVFAPPPAASLSLPGSVEAAPRPTDAEIRAVARRIARAVRRPPPDDQSSWLLAKAQEFAPEDEARVEAALEALRAGRRRPARATGPAFR